MSKLVTVIGATGTQGGSVIQQLLKNHEYKLRAITRNPSSEKAKALSDQGVEVVQADNTDLESLKAAFAGSYAVFAVTNFFDAWPSRLGMDDAAKLETEQGLNMAKAAAATSSLQHYIWSTLPNSRRITDGKIVVPYWESKNRVDDFIKSDAALASKTTFFWSPYYAENINFPFYKPVAFPNANPDLLVATWTVPASAPITMAGEASTNGGIFVESILKHRGKTLRTTVLGAVEYMTIGEMTSLWAELNGKKGVVVEVERPIYAASWPPWGELMDLSHTIFHIKGRDTFSGEPIVLTKDDLGITGLVDTRTAFKNIMAQTQA